MKPTFTISFSSPVEQEILNEEKNYKVALKSNANPEVLKGMRTSIKLLKVELSEQRLNYKDQV